MKIKLLTLHTKADVVDGSMQNMRLEKSKEDEIFWRYEQRILNLIQNLVREYSMDGYRGFSHSSNGFLSYKLNRNEATIEFINGLLMSEEENEYISDYYIVHEIKPIYDQLNLKFISDNFNYKTMEWRGVRLGFGRVQTFSTSESEGMRVSSDAIRTFLASSF